MKASGSQQGSGKRHLCSLITCSPLTPTHMPQHFGASAASFAAVELAHAADKVAHLKGWVGHANLVMPSLIKISIIAVAIIPIIIKVLKN